MHERQVAQQDPRSAAVATLETTIGVADTEVAATDTAPPEEPTAPGSVATHQLLPVRKTNGQQRRRVLLKAQQAEATRAKEKEVRANMFRPTYEWKETEGRSIENEVHVERRETVSQGTLTKQLMARI